jgi:nitrate/nitrite-specific signal transduction histidine kinase
MAERAAALGGKLTIKSHPSEGTSVSVAIPSNGSAGSDMEVVYE